MRSADPAVFNGKRNNIARFEPCEKGERNAEGHPDPTRGQGMNASTGSGLVYQLYGSVFFPEIESIAS